MPSAICMSVSIGRLILLTLQGIPSTAMKKLSVASLLWLVVTGASTPDDFCGISNTTFSSGEVIDFKVFYSVIGIYVDAGDARFTVDREQLNGKPVYHIVGVGNSNPRYDWIFKVRDKYQSYIDTSTLRPYRFIRNVYEGGYTIFEDVAFDPKANIAESKKGRYSVPPCVQDVLSAIYYARNIDFDRYKPGDKIPFSMFIDNEVYNLFIRYLGKEVVKTRYGRYNAIKFRPLLIKGTLFEGGEKMTVWVSDDRNHVPLRIESPITVGSVKVDMKGYANLRHPFSAKIAESR